MSCRVTPYRGFKSRRHRRRTPEQHCIPVRFGGSFRLPRVRWLERPWRPFPSIPAGRAELVEQRDGAALASPASMDEEERAERDEAGDTCVGDRGDQCPREDGGDVRQTERSECLSQSVGGVAGAGRMPEPKTPRRGLARA